MWVEVILAKNDLDEVINDFCPLKIHLGDDGSIVLSDPRSLELVPAVGLRMSITAAVHWPILGIQIPVSVRSATLEIKPEILKKPEGDHLTFKLRLDDVDISILPAIIDRSIVDLVNRELDAKHVELSWNFIETLSHVFELPDALVSARAIDLSAAWGVVRITSEALVLAVSFDAGVEPRGVGTEPASTPTSTAIVLPVVNQPSSERKGLRRLWRESPVSVAVVVGGSWLAGMSVAALLLGLGRRRPRLRLHSFRNLTRR
jgi:hypothetical protein